MAFRLRQVALIVVYLLAMQLVCQAGIQQEANQNAFLIDAHKVAGISVGDSAESVYRQFHGNVRLVDRQLEGTLSPALTIQPEGASREDAIVADLECNGKLVICRIIVNDPAFRTRSGIGVGSTVGQLRSHHEIASVSTAEWSCGIWVEELSLGFSLDISSLHKEADSWKHPSDIPDNVKIACVILSRGEKHP